MTAAGLEFTVRVPDVEERFDPALPPGEAVMRIAEQKAGAVAALCPDDTVIGADTVVTLGDAVLGKPKDERNAADMLRMLSGQTHTVYTGVCVVRGGEARSFFEQTDVTFYPLSEAEILAYAATGEPMDKAGAYGIQGRGAALVKEIHGDYLNVVGLPLARLLRELNAQCANTVFR
ncbi:MAG: Maf family protein [Oscillospiraceae bacterium]|nr:Maf family protein [Oscillospiraceae bacterium]